MKVFYFSFRSHESVFCNHLCRTGIASKLRVSKQSAIFQRIIRTPNHFSLLFMSSSLLPASVSSSLPRIYFYLFIIEFPQTSPLKENFPLSPLFFLCGLQFSRHETILFFCQENNPIEPSEIMQQNGTPEERIFYGMTFCSYRKLTVAFELLDD